MLFHTWTFIVFFAVVYPVYLLLRKTPLRTPWLFLASYTFYGWWSPLFLLLILFSSTVDYFVVTRMARDGRRGLWLAVSVLSNLGLLGFFKYSVFLTENLNALLAAMGVPYVLPMPDLLFFNLIHSLNEGIASVGLPYAVPVPNSLLPVGISFFVFQSMSYTIDYYRGYVGKENSFLRYATFVALFPQLVAGPIERAKNLLPQLNHPLRVTRRDLTDGLSLFVVGLFKKVAVADYLAGYVDKIYGAPEQFQSPALVLATFAFGWQIYCDFSGYTDMARGVARMMGVRLMLNFNNPYLATGLGDFWARWHISLSTWFKDYVYIPLGGNREGPLATYRNMFLTMLISGLWHGAAWTFVIWGALHAVGRVITRELERSWFYQQRVPKIAKQLGVFVFVTFTWIFFRASTFEDAQRIVVRIFTTGWADPQFPLIALGLILAIWVYQFLYESPARKCLESGVVRISSVVGMILYLAFFAPSGEQPFIYFQF